MEDKKKTRKEKMEGGLTLAVERAHEPRSGGKPQGGAGVRKELS
jgi:hypothetical protein